MNNNYEQHVKIQKLFFIKKRYTMNIKALFFDIDGTLVSFKTHKIQSSTIEALQKVKEKGIKIYISTGRPLGFITNLSEIEHLIDGYITTNGAFSFTKNSVISKHPMNKEEVLLFIDYAKKYDFCSIVIGTKHIAVINAKEILERIFVKGLHITTFDLSIPVSKVLEDDVLQITPFIPQSLQDEIMPSLPHCIATRWHPEFIDVSHIEATKGKALKEVAMFENISLDNIMAFGDGENDISILVNSGIGVAMGNASDNVKAHANYVTSSVDDNGIAKALQHFNVI